MQATANNDVLFGGFESRSRKGYVEGSINGDMDTYVDTYDHTLPAEDWFAITLSEPATIGRVVFTHGVTVYNGGWFDTSAGKPKVRVQLTKDGEWKTVGELTDYPATTAASAANLIAGTAFTCQLSAPMKVLGVRVVGKPASGNNPAEAYSTCSKLQAF